MKLWTESELTYLREHYPNTRTLEMSEHLGRSVRAINLKANILYLKKSSEFIKSQLNGGVPYQYKKGQPAHNKNKKWSDYMSKEKQEKLLKTCFKKGNLPINTKEDGAITIRKDKLKKDYKFIRLAKSKWIALHVHLWKQHHGEIPKGLIIVFKDNNPMNCTIENLEAITRIENMKRNTYHRYPNELKRTLKLLKNVKSKLKSSESNPV